MILLQLDQLPSEIIQRILAQGSCLSALHLSRVNRSLRLICTRPLVYQDIVKHGNGFTSNTQGVGESEPLGWWLGRRLNLENDWHTCAQWALADMELQEAIRNVASPHISFDKLLKFLPELISQNHELAPVLVLRKDTSIDHLRANSLWRRSSEASQSVSTQYSDVDMITRAAFISACRCCLLQGNDREAEVPPLASFRPANPHQLNWYIPGLLGDTISEFISIANDASIWNSNALLTDTNMMTTWRTSREQELHWLRCITLSTVMAGILYRRLTIALGHPTFGFLATSSDSYNLFPPPTTNIQFGKFYRNMAPPFSKDTYPNDTVPFITKHIATMSSSEFLSHGEWVGYYCYNLSQGVPAWDPMMHSIFFEVTADYADHCAVTSRGEDGVGPFTLLGIVNKSTGWVQMTKDYVETGTSWRWSAVLTPFGIVGSWGDDWGGWFWLWKKAWSPRDARKLSTFNA